jgi:hypothetical protein
MLKQSVDAASETLKKAAGVPVQVARGAAGAVKKAAVSAGKGAAARKSAVRPAGGARQQGSKR